MATARLKAEINERVRNNGDVLLAISKATGKSFGTVKNWFYTDSEHLVNYNTLSAISKFTGILTEQLIEETEMAVKI